MNNYIIAGKEVKQKLDILLDIEKTIQRKDISIFEKYDLIRFSMANLNLEKLHDDSYKILVEASTPTIDNLKDYNAKITRQRYEYEPTN
jgi:hypothetical protein